MFSCFGIEKRLPLRGGAVICLTGDSVVVLSAWGRGAERTQGWALVVVQEQCGGSWIPGVADAQSVGSQFESCARHPEVWSWRAWPSVCCMGAAPSVFVCLFVVCLCGLCLCLRLRSMVGLVAVGGGPPGFILGIPILSGSRFYFRYSHFDFSIRVF